MRPLPQTLACLLALLTLVSGPALANRCLEPTRIGPRSGDVIAPIGTVANDVIDQALAAAQAEQDLLRALATLQNSQFSMLHPDAPEGARQTAYFTVRCASADRYEALDEAMARRVQAVQDEYRRQGWYLGGNQLLPNFKGEYADGKPGLLNLLLIANRFEAFEQEAAQFLDRAIGDAMANEYFETINHIASVRRRELERWQSDYASEYARGGVGLLPRERDGITTLAGIEDRLAVRRDKHVTHWLDKEAEQFEKLLADAEAPRRLLAINLQSGIGADQLELALGLAREQDKARIIDRARARGERLARQERHDLAVPYFQLAGDKQRLAAAQAAADASAAQRTENVRAAAEAAMGDIIKSDDEKAAFEDETDALADELGIDLDDF
jgi:hypothetical protein